MAWHADDLTNLATCCDDLTLQVWRPSHELPLSRSPVCAGSRRPACAVGAMAATEAPTSEDARKFAEPQKGLYSPMGNLVQNSLGHVLLSSAKGLGFMVKGCKLQHAWGQPGAPVCSVLSAWESPLCMPG